MITDEIVDRSGNPTPERQMSSRLEGDVAVIMVGA